MHALVPHPRRPRRTQGGLRAHRHGRRRSGFARLAELVRTGGRAATPIGDADIDGLAKRQLSAADLNDPLGTGALATALGE